MNETDTSPEKEHVVTNDEKKENSDINFFEYGAHFKYNELCLVLAHLANNKKPTQCITLSKKEEKKKESIEIKSRNFNVNYVVKNSNYYFNEHKIITKDNKTNINKKGVIHGERILNALHNNNIKVIKTNKNRVNAFKDNNHHNIHNNSKAPKSTSNPKKTNAKPISIVKIDLKNKTNTVGKKSKSQNVIKNNIIKQKNNDIVKRKAYSSSNSKKKTSNFPLQYAEIQLDNPNPKRIATVNCIKSMVKKSLRQLGINSVNKSKSKSTSKGNSTKKYSATIELKSRNSNIKKMNHLQTDNNIKKVDRLSSHKKNTSNTHQKKLNYKEIKDKVSSINQNIRVTNKFHTLNISKKEIKYPSSSKIVKTTPNSLCTSQNNAKPNSNITISIDVSDNNDKVSIRNKRAIIKNHILTSSINKMKKHIEQLYQNNSKTKNQVRSHNNTNLYTNPNIIDSSKDNQNNSFLNKNRIPITLGKYEGYQISKKKYYNIAKKPKNT